MAKGQQPERTKVTINGEIVMAEVRNGDTLIVAELDGVTVTSPRTFNDAAEYRRYNRYRRYANKVYPYAVASIKLFREVDRDTGNMRKSKRRKHIRKLQKELKKEFTDPLKNLTRIQGKILVKMIENELDKNMFDLLKGLKGGFAAAKWNTVGKLYGYNLKEGYMYGEDPILDAILQDFDISYEVE
jgi:hypothetical protein